MNVKVTYFSKFSCLHTFFGGTMLAGYPVMKLKSEIKFLEYLNVVVLTMMSHVRISIFTKKFKNYPSDRVSKLKNWDIIIAKSR